MKCFEDVPNQLKLRSKFFAGDANPVDWIWGEKFLLRVAGFILFTSTGFGIVELDFCCSGKLAKKMQESSAYEVMHLLFRVSEVLSRTVMHVMFVLWRQQNFFKTFKYWKPEADFIGVSMFLMNRDNCDLCLWLSHLLFSCLWVEVVTTKRLVQWWWCPSASNFIFSYLLLVFYGGDEKRFLVRLLCSVPCTWVTFHKDFRCSSCFEFC